MRHRAGPAHVAAPAVRRRGPLAAGQPGQPSGPTCPTTRRADSRPPPPPPLPKIAPVDPAGRGVPGGRARCCCSGPTCCRWTRRPRLFLGFAACARRLRHPDPAAAPRRRRGRRPGQRGPGLSYRSLSSQSSDGVDGLLPAGVQHEVVAHTRERAAASRRSGARPSPAPGPSPTTTRSSGLPTTSTGGSRRPAPRAGDGGRAPAGAPRGHALEAFGVGLGVLGALQRPAEQLGSPLSDTRPPNSPGRVPPGVAARAARTRSTRPPKTGRDQHTRPGRVPRHRHRHHERPGAVPHQHRLASAARRRPG